MRPSRKAALEIFNNPILIGAITILVLAVAVYLSYIAENGLPFVPTYNINVDVPNANELVKNADVRIGGARVGQVLTIKPQPAGTDPGYPHPFARLGLSLQTSLKPLPYDTRYQIRLASVLGGKFLELLPGNDHNTPQTPALPDGGTFQLGTGIQRNIPPQVGVVQPGGAAAAAGFKPGDLVLAIDGRAIASFADMQSIVRANAGKALVFEVERDGERVTLRATPAEINKQGILGIQSPHPALRPVGAVRAFELGLRQTRSVIDRTFSYIGGVIVGREAANQLGGPIRIAQVAGQAAEEGMPYFLNLAAVISISIGLLNLFPVPLLDGGHLMFYGIEAVRGKPLSERAQEVGFRIGFAIVVMLMIFATYNDILHFLSGAS